MKEYILSWVHPEITFDFITALGWAALGFIVFVIIWLVVDLIKRVFMNDSN